MRTNALRRPSKGFTLVELAMLIVVLAFIGSQVLAYYKKGEVAEYLAEKLPTVSAAYHTRAHSPYKAMELSRDAYLTRAPGTYLRVVSMWKDFATADTNERAKQDPGWLIAEKQAEQHKVQELLTQSKVSVEDLVSLEAKLEKISPQLSDAESAKLVELSQPMTLMGLALVNEATAKTIYERLKGMGLSERGLYENGIKEKPDYRD